MRIALFGATGRIGQRAVKEALSRGHSVTAIVHEQSKLNLSDPNLKVIQGDVTDVASVARAVPGSEAVISAVGPKWDGSNNRMLVDAAHALLDGQKRAGVKRLLVVGGAGSLEDAPGVERMDMPDFPAAWRPVAKAHGEALEIYRQEKDLDWSYLSPANMIEPGTRTGKYRTGTEQLVRDADGKSFISMEDYAVALIDEIEHPKFIRRRFTVGY